MTLSRQASDMARRVFASPISSRAVEAQSFSRPSAAGEKSGGSALNRIPQQAVARAEMRAFTVEAYQGALARLRQLEQDIKVRSVEGGFPCRIAITIESETPPWPRNAASSGSPTPSRR